MAESSELQPSKLGTKNHWDDIYARELRNFEETNDEGEVWFGEDSVEKMADWARAHVPPAAQPAVLEIGSGNGTLLFAMGEAGYDTARMLGVDYSPDAVRLARAIAPTRDAGDLEFRVCDFLVEEAPLRDGQEGWDLVLDKGTYDAIALGDKDEEGRSPAAHYPGRLARLLKPGGYFLITSCNFTEDELKAAFVSPETGLTYHSHIKHRSFTFGGHSGQTISSVAFQKPS